MRLFIGSFLVLLLTAVSGTASAEPTRVYRATLLSEASVGDVSADPTTSMANSITSPGFMAGVSVWSGANRGLNIIDHRIQLDLGLNGQPNGETTVFAIPTWQSTLWIGRLVGFSALAGIGYQQAISPYGTAAKATSAGVDASWDRPGLITQVGLGIEVPLGNHWSLIGQSRATVDGRFNPEDASNSPAVMTTHLGAEYRR